MKIFSLLTLICLSLCSCSTPDSIINSTPVKTYDDGECKPTHYASRSQALSMIQGDIFRSRQLKNGKEHFGNDSIYLDHNLYYSDSADVFFNLLEDIQKNEKARLFIGFDLKIDEKEKDSTVFSTVCLNIIGAIIDDYNVKDIGSKYNIYKGTGCDTTNRDNIKLRNGLLSMKYKAFKPNINKFGVVYNAACLKQALLKDGFEKNEIFFDFAVSQVQGGNDHDFYTTIVFSDEENLRGTADTSSDQMNKLYSKDSFPIFSYAQHGTACCPL